MGRNEGSCQDRREAMNILSLGAGVQSSTLALMAAHGEITPMPDAAIFADTGWEPKKVMQYLDWLEHLLPFPVYRVMHKDGLLEALKGDSRFSSVPFFISNGGLGRRQCTREFKIDPVQKKIRELLGYRPRQRIPAKSATVWIGISRDEIVRMKPSREIWIENRWPLVELGMTRWDCLQWMEKNGYPMPPKSSCLGCPFHSDKQWVEIKQGDQNEWRETIEMDRIIRHRASKMTYQQFMHRSLKPLDEVGFDLIEKQPDMWDDGFGNECEGMCGV